MFRSEAGVIEARQLLDYTSFDEIVCWISECSSVAFYSGGGVNGQFWINVDTLNGVTEARNNHWVIRNSDNMFSSCDPEIFKANYKPVKEE